MGDLEVQNRISERRGTILDQFEKIDFATIFGHFRPHSTPLVPLFGVCNVILRLWRGLDGVFRRSEGAESDPGDPRFKTWGIHAPRTA